MKNFILLTGTIIIVVNSIIGLLFNYRTTNIVFSDISILFSTIAIFFVYRDKLDNVFKVVYTVLYLFTGIGRYFFAILSSETLKNNIFLSFFLILVALEIIFFYLAKYISKNI